MTKLNLSRMATKVTLSENASKFGLLMWKNWKLQIRHPIQTIFEILVPVFFCAILVIVRSLVDSSVDEAVIFPHFNPVFNYYLPNYTIVYSPHNAVTKNVMDKVEDYLQAAQEPQGFDTAKQLENYLISLPTSMKVGIVFPNEYASLTSLPSVVEFTFRFPSELRDYYNNSISVETWKTNMLFPLFQEPGAREDYNWNTASPDYYGEEFLTLQSAISEAIIQTKQKNFNMPNVWMRRFPYPSHIKDFLMLVMKDMISLIIVLAFEYTSISIIKIITTEKEKQLKESMKIMGLPGWLHWTAWFVKSFLFMMISIVLMVTLFKISFWYDDNIPAVFPECSFVLLFIFMALFAVSTITLCFAISVFFTKANMAAGIGGVLFFLFLVPFTILAGRYQELTLSTKLSASLMSNTAMGYGFQLICKFESTGEGLQWNNLFRPVTPDDDLTMAHIFLMLIIDSIIYMCIALYVEAIFPGRYGVAKRWDFIFTWMCKNKDTKSNNVHLNSNIDATRYEVEPTSIKSGIDIRGLTKVYGKDKVAVNNMHLKMYQDEITVLLGHNGAGKTTTMSMLTGMENPTSGTAIINDHDLRTEIDQVRTSLGLCPQHNILFDELTVAEHIYFYARLKGMHASSIDNEITDYVKLLQLEDKRDMKSSTLSGGMKRKLSVAVAFCGGSKVVMLDEPTAGMDPAARRALWELVESQKRGRTIMLTTHFMDEADLLGDRIAIMAGGELQCCGSSFFLKKRYGAGYHLIVAKLVNCDVDRVTNTIKTHIPNVKVESNIGSELTYLLSEEDSVHFEKMLSDIESNLGNLGIGSYGISLTTLEEVFMKVGADNILQNETNSNGNHYETINGFDHNANNDNKDTKLDVEEKQLLTGGKLRLNQIRAMIMKRFLSTVRSWPLFAVQLLIPIILLVLAVLSGRQSSTKELPNLTISLDSYHETVTLVTSNTSNDKYYTAASNWLSSNGFTTETVDNVTDFMLNKTKAEPGKVRMSYLIGGEFDDDDIIGWFNNDPYHTPPLVLNFLYNSIIKTINPEYEIRISHHPLPMTTDSTFKLLQQGNNMGFQLAINIGFCMTFISAFYILFYVRERVCKAKHLQFVSGVNMVTFWLVSYVWDWCTFILTIICLLVTLICFQEDGFKTGQDIGHLIVIFLYFGFGMFPFIYILSLWYELPSTGFTRVILFTTILGTFGFMIVEILYFDGLDLVNVAKVLDWIFMFVPHYALTGGIRNTNMEYQRITACGKIYQACFDACIDTGLFPAVICDETCWKIIGEKQADCKVRTEEYFAWERPGILRNIILSLIVGFVLSVVLLMVEFKMFAKIIYAFQSKKEFVSDENMDDDVKAEMEKMRNLTDGEINNYNLVLRNMTKYYKNFPAVKGLCLGVNRYECFGLLGVNGAGKTTSFKMITGDTDISSGDVFVKGLDLKYNIKEVYKQIGYCPQFDALFDDLTGRETITVFSLLRGFERAECDYIAEKLAKNFDFLQHLDKKVREMSGGNKRKLSTAVALIGDPPIIYLDEPTTGMDPATKRHLWNALCKLRDQGKCLILTTHSMEECEALCTRLAIMVNGQFKCLGSTQHLKNKFSRGFALTIKIKKQVDYTTLITKLAQFVQANFPSAELREQHQEMISYYIPDSGLPWSKMFGIMERSKHELEIEDYSLGQSSLEQVFLKFTQQQY